MIVLQASAFEGRLVVWGEAPEEGGTGQKRSRGGAYTPYGPPRPLPFGAKADLLRQALDGVVDGPALMPKEVGTWIAWLPSAKGKPVASSPLVAEPPTGAVDSVAAWEVSGIPLGEGPAVDLLATCEGKATLAQGIVVGPTLAYWAAVLRFAGALVANQRFLPGVERTNEAFRARWEPVIAGEDALRLARLAKGMPHAARAVSRSAWVAPSNPAASALSAVLTNLVDHLVRPTVAEPAVAGSKRTAKAKESEPFASVHDLWWHALRSPDGRMKGDHTELSRLADQVTQWRRPIAAEASAPFRLSFRLEEPEGEKDDWYVRYLLQSAADPSLLVPASKAWERWPKELATKQFRPREYLLSALGQSSSLSPRIEESLKESRPDGYRLDATGAHDFLTSKASLLEQAGFGVMLPSWWSRKGTRLRLGAKGEIKSPKMTSKAGMSLEAILNFRWKIALGDQELTLKELKALAKMKAPLVKVRGQWVQLSAEEIQEALDFWKKKGEKVTARQAVHMALGVARAPGGLAFEGVDISGWLGDVVAGLKGGAAYEALVPPDGFRGALRPYQERGYSWLGFLRRWGFGACLADDMGLGKTVQTLVSVQRDWDNAAKRRPTLLICPMSVVGNWRKEAAKFTPDLPVMVHHGLGRTKGAAFKKAAGKQALVLSSYALLHRDFEALKSVDWSGVVLDEAQNIKNPQTKQAKAALALKADYKVALTGTPVENHVGDLWSIMEFLNPGLLGNQAEFKRNFHVPIQAGRDPEAAETLRKITGPFILRRLKSDKSIIADLPDKMEMKVFCNLTKEQATLYQAVADEAVESIESSEGIQRKGIVLATLAKLKQVCNHPAQFLKDNSPVAERSGKLDRLTEMLGEALDAGDRALIFSQFAEMGEILRKHLQSSFGREVPFLHGGVSKAGRDRMVDRFQATGPEAPRLFILSLKAGGTGLNLTAANHVFHFDRWWNPAVEDQATDRAFRIGQKKRVQVHKFVCLGTLEEMIDDLIEKKKQVAGTVVGSGEDWLTKLSTEELRDLFTLRKEAIAS